jgi:uncharacterized membrane protein YhhN
MSLEVPRLLPAVMLLTGTCAIWAMDTGSTWVAALFKPLTTVLLFFVLGKVSDSLRRKVAIGLAFSLLGDVLLLGKTGIWFQLGLAAFLVTHACYIYAFIPFFVWHARVFFVGLSSSMASVATLVGAHSEATKAGVFLPVAVYAAAITGTLITSSATVGSALSRGRAASLGALLFYLADTCIALDVFVPALSLPHPAVFTTGVYWIGQYYITLAARAGMRQPGQARDAR